MEWIAAKIVAEIGKVAAAPKVSLEATNETASKTRGTTKALQVPMVNLHWVQELA